MSTRHTVLFWVSLLVYFLSMVGIGAVVGTLLAESGEAPARPVPAVTTGGWEL